MKTVSGEVLSTQSASLSQAARTIAAFVSADNGGASQAVAAYLKRTSSAFNHLVQFHKDHKTPDFKIKKCRPVDMLNSDQVGGEFGGEKKKKKKNRKSEEIVEGENGNFSEQNGHIKKKRRRLEGDD